MNVSVLCLSITMPWIGLQRLFLAFPGNTDFFIVMSKVERRCRQGVLILAKDNNIVSKGAEIRNRHNQVPHLT